MRLTTTVYMALALFASAAMAKPPTVVTALSGLDPVSLLDGQEQMGDENRAVVRGRYRYLFATAETQRRFEAAPEDHSVQLDGACARMGPLSGLGAPSRFWVHDRRIYLFASDQCRTAFKSGPARFLESPDVPAQGTAAEQARGAELIALALTGFGGADKVDNLSTYRLQTKITYGEGKEATSGQAIVTVDFSGRIRAEQVWGDDRFSDIALRDGGLQVQGTEWWPISEKSASYLRRSIYRSPLAVLRLRKEPGFVAFSAGPGQVGDAPVEYLKTSLGGATTTFAIEVASGRILQATFRGRYSALGELERTFSDFREVQGLVVPHKIDESFDGRPIASPAKSIESIAFNERLDDALFREPD